MQPPRLSEYDDNPVYNTRAVVLLTRVQAPRLRAWERRYAILAPHRNANSYRLYSERDLAIIRWLRDQVESGMTISQATSYLRQNEGEQQPSKTQANAPLAHLELPALADELVSAALQMDEGNIRTILSQAIAAHSIEDVCVGLIVPAMSQIGAFWEERQDVIIAEHFLSGIVRAQLDAIWQLTYQPTDGPLVVVGCVPTELHELGGFMLALFLRRMGVRVSYLGQNIERKALVRYAQSTRPAAICLSVTMAENVTSTLAVVREVLAIPGIEVYVGGQAIVAGSLAGIISPRLHHLMRNGPEAAQQIKRKLVEL